MTSRLAVGIRFSATPIANGAAVQIDLPEDSLDFDVANVLRASLGETVASYLGEGYRSFVLDVHQVTRIDSCGVGLLIGMHHQVVAAGGTLVVVTSSPFVRRVLRMMRLDRFLDLETSVDRALRALVDVD